MAKPKPDLAENAANSAEVEVFTVHCKVDGVDVDDVKYNTCIACTLGPTGDFQLRPDALRCATHLAREVFEEVCRDFPKGKVEAYVSSDRIESEWKTERSW